MFWHKANTIFIICSYFSIYGLIETLTPQEISTICAGSTDNIAHPNDNRAYLSCGTTPKSVKTCAVDECFKDSNSLCDATVCPIKLSPQDMLGLCTGQPELAMMPYTNNQNKFILCTENDPLSIECPYEKCFNKKLQKCDESACAVTGNTNPIDGSVKALCQSSDDTYFEKIPGDTCESYYICMGTLNEPIHKKCPSNLHYSEEYKMCTNPMQAECAVPSKWCKNKENGIKFAASNCYEYYECIDGLAKSQSCLYNEHFDVEQSKCVKGLCINKDGSVREPTCSNVQEGVYIDHPKCNKFFVCSTDGLYEGRCTAGYYFSSRLRQCVRDITNNCKL